VCDCTQAQPGRDMSSVTGDQQQVSQVPSSSHLSVDTDDSNILEPGDVSERASVPADKHRKLDAW